MQKTIQQRHQKPVTMLELCQMFQKRREKENEKRPAFDDQATLRRPRTQTLPYAIVCLPSLNPVQPQQKREKVIRSKKGNSVNASTVLNGTQGEKKGATVLPMRPNQLPNQQVSRKQGGEQVAVPRRTEELTLSEYMEAVRTNMRREIEEAREHYEKVKRRLKQKSLNTTQNVRRP